MNILLLGDIMGPSGRKALIKKLPDLIKQKKTLKNFLELEQMLLLQVIMSGMKKKQWNLFLQRKDY